MAVSCRSACRRIMRAAASSAWDLSTGKSEILFDQCGDHALRAPKDIVFDRRGGFWFTDSGRTYARLRDHGGVYYAADGKVREAIYPLLTPCGIGLTGEEDALYVSDALPGRLWAFDLLGPGQAAPPPPEAEYPGRLICTLPGVQTLDSLALDSQGRVCVATGGHGGITPSRPDMWRRSTSQATGTAATS